MLLSRLSRRGAAAVAATAAASASLLFAARVVESQAAERDIESEQRARADAFVDWTDPDESYVEALKTLRASFDMPVSTMRETMALFLSEAAAGLAGQPSSMRMLPTFVDRRVTGQETGDFYALDLGGTNFRVLKLSLLGGGRVGPVTQGKYAIPTSIKQGTGESLFGFLADSVATFLATNCGGNPSGAMGFTFSFPTTQEAINSGKLIVWNKEFTASGCIGEDVVALLQAQLQARGINLEVKALANDTVGTMEAAAYANPNTAMGVILGTGTNAAYIEKTANVGKWAGKPSEEMVINTEWGNLDMAAVMNLADAAIDAASANPGLQRFEKMISGMYLGELARVSVLQPEVLQGFSDGFAASLLSKFGAKMTLPTALAAKIEEDVSPGLTDAAKALRDAGLANSTARDRALLREACVCVSTRAARLSAVGVVSLLEQMGHASGECTIAIDGTVFECYPFFKERMEHGIELMIGQERACEVRLLLAKDGSGVGAAIISAISES